MRKELWSCSCLPFFSDALYFLLFCGNVYCPGRNPKRHEKNRYSPYDSLAQAKHGAREEYTDVCKYVFLFLGQRTFILAKNNNNVFGYISLSPGKKEALATSYEKNTPGVGISWKVAVPVPLSSTPLRKLERHGLNRHFSWYMAVHWKTRCLTIYFTEGPDTRRLFKLNKINLNAVHSWCKISLFLTYNQMFHSNCVNYYGIFISERTARKRIVFRS